MLDSEGRFPSWDKLDSVHEVVQYSVHAPWLVSVFSAFGLHYCVVALLD